MKVTFGGQSMSSSSEIPEKPSLTSSVNQDNPKPLKSGILAWTDFCQDFAELSDLSYPSAVSLEYFVRRNLRQFHLTSISESDVLTEVFLRAYKLIVLGGGVIIRYPGAWVRRTAFNYIRELSRDHQRTSSMEFDLPDQESSPLIDQLILQADIAVLKRALQELDPDEKRLLTLKMIDELSWAEIKIVLAGEGKIHSETALRKQKERALKHLRQVYHALRPLSELERKLEEQ
jgi:RNA polymerase sigma factor (sigma-70 family)